MARRGFRIDRLFQDTATPVLLLDRDAEIVFLNAPCETLLGRPAEQLIGLRCRYQPATGDSDLSDLSASLAPPPEFAQSLYSSVRTVIRPPVGEAIWRRVHFIRCNDTAGDPFAVLVVIDRDYEVSGAPPQVQGREQLGQLRDRMLRRFGIDKLIGTGPRMDRVIAQVRAASRCDANVFVWGEPGTGRQYAARVIHAESDRSSAPIVAVDCAGLPAELTERDLFGTRSPQPAGPRDQGLVRAMQRGTVILKDISRLKRDAQLMLLDFAQPAGDSEPKGGREKPGLRLIATDTAAPDQLPADLVRQDLLCLLTTIVIYVPPLRDRKDDIPLLAQAFLTASNADTAKQVHGLAADAVDILIAYHWPGNLRELRSVMAVAHAACGGSVIAANDLPAKIRGDLGGAHASATAEPTMPLDVALADTERQLIEAAIRRARGNKSVAADMLAITRPRLYRRMQQLGMVDAAPGATGPTLPENEPE